MSDQSSVLYGASSFSRSRNLTVAASAYIDLVVELLRGNEMRTQDEVAAMLRLRSPG
jgi:hypothetical protein